jgi:hypothetical protein
MKDLLGKDEEVVAGQMPNFEDFYKHYPVKKSRKVAEKSWERKNITWDQLRIIVIDIRRRLKWREWRLEEPQYIPHPSTYLNQERWTDTEDLLAQRADSNNFVALPPANKNGVIERDWTPDAEAVAILQRGGISVPFIEDAVAEFALYWRENATPNTQWNTKFIAHVRRQWVKYTHALEHDTTPRPIPPDFQPDPACLDVLAMANIDIDFALAQLPEFLLYWQDRKEAHSSWNTKFLQHVKYKWAQHMQPAGQPLLERLTDRSWAE